MEETNKEFVDFVNGKMKTDSPWSCVDAWAGKDAELLFEGKTGAIVAVKAGDFLAFWRNGAEHIHNEIPFEKGGLVIETQRVSAFMSASVVTERKQSGAHINGALPVIIHLPFGEDGTHSTRYEQHHSYADDFSSLPLTALLSEAIAEKGTDFGIYLLENGALPQDMPKSMWENRTFVDLAMAEEPYMLPHISRDILSYEDGLKALKHEEAHMLIEEGAFNIFFEKFPAVKEEILAGDHGADVRESFKEWNEFKPPITYDPFNGKWHHDL